jgi:hypothetical protein
VPTSSTSSAGSETRRRALAAALLLAAAGAAAGERIDRLPHPEARGVRPPARGAELVDPVFGTRILRVSDAVTTRDAASGGSLGWAMTEYATVSAFNDDASLFLLQHGSYFALYERRGRGARYLRDLPFEITAHAEPRWSRRDRFRLYFVSGNRLGAYDARTGALEWLRRFDEYEVVSGHGEADIGFRDDRLVLAGDGREIFVYEIAADRKGPVLDTTLLGVFDGLYLTPEDDVIVTWQRNGAERWLGIELYDGATMELVRKISPANGHLDVTRGDDGRGVVVFTNASEPEPICENGIVAMRLADGRARCLVSLDWSLAVHVSCPDGDGGCVVGTFFTAEPEPGTPWPPYAGELFRVAFDGSPPRRLAHHRSRPSGDYNFSPRASISRDGRHLLFSSNFGLPGERPLPADYVDAYLLAIPPLLRR